MNERRKHLAAKLNVFLYLSRLVLRCFCTAKLLYDAPIHPPGMALSRFVRDEPPDGLGHVPLRQRVHRGTLEHGPGPGGRRRRVVAKIEV